MRIPKRPRRERESERAKKWQKRATWEEEEAQKHTQKKILSSRRALRAVFLRAKWIWFFGLSSIRRVAFTLLFFVDLDAIACSSDRSFSFDVASVARAKLARHYSYVAFCLFVWVVFEPDFVIYSSLERKVPIFACFGRISGSKLVKLARKLL